MTNKTLHINFFILLVIDAILLAGSFFVAHLLRFDFNLPKQNLILFGKVLPFALIIKLLIFYYCDLYRGMWRYTSIVDLTKIIKAATISSLVIVIYLLFKTRFIGYSRSIFFMDWAFTILFIAAFRLSIRIYYEKIGENYHPLYNFRFAFQRVMKRKENLTKLLIIGAGDCGEKILREINENSQLRYKVVGFLDDQDDKIGKNIHGIPILGKATNVKKISKSFGAEELLIAITFTNSRRIRRIIQDCKESGLPFKTVPGIGELINGKMTVRSIRKVDYADLLGRDVVKLDEKKIGLYLKGQTVLVTGAGGSIGSELCRQICRYHPSTVILYERSESPLYEIELDLKSNFSNVKVVPILADIQDKLQLEKIFSIYNPQIIFHSAAFKHVPMLEFQPWRAIENNILGTLNIVEVAKQFNTSRFIFISTDKAVHPVSVMGATKRIAEMLIQGQNHDNPSDIKFMIVRFGNVVGSIGSVVPLFKKQIAKGGPVTVTHPEVTRYFMTIPEACQLILQAGVLGHAEHAEIFILDMGTPIKIADMARDMISLSGFEPDVDIRVEFTGLRPGEKLHEELMTECEGIEPTYHEKILALRGEVQNKVVLYEHIEELAHLAKKQSSIKIKNKLKEIVPDYDPQQGSGEFE